MEASATRSPIPSDHLRWRALRYLATFIIPLGAWATFTDRGLGYWTVPVVSFCCGPLH